MDTRTQLDAWREELLKPWDDDRIMSREDIDAWMWFLHHSYADLSQINLELDGFTFREKGDVWLLVLKVHEGDTPLVGFITSQNPTRCVSKTRKLLRNGGLGWIKDKYR